MIKITEKAISRLERQMSDRGKGLGIRLSIKKTGCSGLSYIVDFVDQSDANDHKVACGKYSVFLDHNNLQYFDGLTIDYEKSLFNEGYKFINLNEKDRCGCGKSFKI